MPDYDNLPYGIPLDTGGLAGWLANQQNADASWNMFNQGPLYPGPQDRGNEETEGAGTVGVLPQVQEMEIQSWFEANPNATAQDIFDVMQTNNLSPESVINAMGLDPESAMAAYNTFLNPTPPVPATPTVPPVTPPATDTGMFDDLLGGARDATTAVAGVIDTGLKQLGELMGMGDPSLVVLNPVNPTASVVYGTPQGNTTPTIIGNMPKSGAPVGVITGIPALDDILAGVFNQRGQGGKSIDEIIRDVVLAKIGDESGYPVAGVVGATQGGLSGDLDEIINSVNKVVLQIDKKIEEQDKVDPIAGVTGPSPDGQMGPQQPKVTPDTSTPPKVPPDSVTTVLADSPGVTTGSLTPADLGEGGLETISPTQTAPKADVLKTPTTPTAGQGVRMEATEKAGLAEIDNQFDLNASLVENLMRILSSESDSEQEVGYYGGGTVAPYANVDEIIRLLRG
jgi:hypothetical protein